MLVFAQKKELPDNNSLNLNMLDIKLDSPHFKVNTFVPPAKFKLTRNFFLLATYRCLEGAVFRGEGRVVSSFHVECLA